MLSPGHTCLAAQPNHAGANSLASGHALDAPQLKFAAGNNLDSGQSRGELHIQPARVNPLAVGQFIHDSEVQRSLAYGNSLTPGQDLSATHIGRAGAAFQWAISPPITKSWAPAELNPASKATTSTPGPPGPFDNHEAREQ